MTKIDKIKTQAAEWAEECGLVPPIHAAKPERVDFPKYGFGYRVVVQELSGKKRIGTAMFNEKGNPTIWTMDGIVGL